MPEEWVPKTKLGKLVKSGEVTSLEEAYEKKLPLLEFEIIDALVPGLQEELLEKKTVQRVTDSGRKGSFAITIAVGNKNGYAGVGVGRGVGMRETIERGVREAKKNLVHVRRGCGHWECACGQPHSLPFRVAGKKASVRIELKPAPRGTGVLAAETAATILRMAGVQDVWTRATGSTSTTLNLALAVMDALKNTRRTRLKKEVGAV